MDQCGQRYGETQNVTDNTDEEGEQRTAAHPTGEQTVPRPFNTYTYRSDLEG